MVMQIKTNAELESILKSPEQMAAYIAEVAAESMGEHASPIIEGAVQRALAKSKLPGRVPLNEGAISAQSIQYAKNYELAKKAGWASNDYTLASYAGDPQGGFETFGKFVAAVTSIKNGGSHPLLKSALAEAAGSLGGNLVPEAFNMQLRMLQLEQAQFRGRSTVLPMTTMVEHWPYVRDTSHVNSVYGGVIGYWEAEAAALSESEPTFAMLTLTAHKLTAYTVASNEVLTDSGGAIESFISQQFPKALNFFEERAFWKGVGGGQPKGVLNASALVSVTRDTTGHITWQDIVNMSSHFLPSSENNMVWFANPSIKPDLYTMALNVGTGGNSIFVNPFTGGGANTMPNQLMGRPLVFTEHLSALGTKGDLVAADLSYYLIGDRQSLGMVASPHVKFVNDQTVFRFIERLDGQPWLDSSLTLEDGSTTVSPFVCIAT